MPVDADGGLLHQHRARRSPSRASPSADSTDVGVEEHRHHDVGAAHGVGGGVGDRGAGLGERLGLGAGAVPDAQREAGGGDVAGHPGAHRAGAQQCDGRLVGHVSVLRSGAVLSFPRSAVRVPAATYVHVLSASGTAHIPRAPARPDRRWRALAVTLLVGFMSLLDVTIVNVAVPSIQQGLHASSASIQWIVSGYALTFGLTLVAGGRLGDVVGRRADVPDRAGRASR